MAEELRYDFVDTDALIEQRHGKTIAEIFAVEGEEKFRQYEQDVLCDLLHQKNLVIACGGGLPCFFDNMERMNACGATIYLKAEVELLAQRIEKENNNRQRPLLEGKTGPELREHIAQLLVQREPYYEQATIVSEQML
ncbi:MAG: shikimate kinase [Bacteroidales bacterium]|nr:shikimate kinase [Bacteroidales bacterium]